MLVIALKKNSRLSSITKIFLPKFFFQIFLPNFTITKISRFYFYFPDFFQVWKIAGQISRLFQEVKTLYEPCTINKPTRDFTGRNNSTLTAHVLIAEIIIHFNLPLVACASLSVSTNDRKKANKRFSRNFCRSAFPTILKPGTSYTTGSVPPI